MHIPNTVSCLLAAIVSAAYVLADALHDTRPTPTVDAAAQIVEPNEALRDYLEHGNDLDNHLEYVQSFLSVETSSYISSQTPPSNDDRTHPSRSRNDLLHESTNRHNSNMGTHRLHPTLLLSLRPAPLTRRRLDRLWRPSEAREKSSRSHTRSRYRRQNTNLNSLQTFFSAVMLMK